MAGLLSNRVVNELSNSDQDDGPALAEPAAALAFSAGPAQRGAGRCAQPPPRAVAVAEKPRSMLLGRGHDGGLGGLLRGAGGAGRLRGLGRCVAGQADEALGHLELLVLGTHA